MFQSLRLKVTRAALLSRLCLLLSLLLLSFFVSLAQAAENRDFTANKLSMPSAIVLGIINYTRWPQPGPSIRTCFFGASDNFFSIRQLASLTQDAVGRQITFPALDKNVALVQQCDLVYVGALSEEETRALIKDTVGMPILTIGEGKEFCSWGGMFCIDTQAEAGSAGFATNLDAISRSKLRVNPQVLRLSSRLNAVLP
jgi:hypothetical protein